MMETAADLSARYTVGGSEPSSSFDAIYRAAAEDYVTEFNRLVREWRRGTMTMSLVSQKTRHPAFAQIVDLGEFIVPLIIAELKKHRDFLYLALPELTGQNPAQNAGGDADAMIDAWLLWAENNPQHAY